MTIRDRIEKKKETCKRLWLVLHELTNSPEEVEEIIIDSEINKMEFIIRSLITKKEDISVKEYMEFNAKMKKILGR